jgi:hypothetical protein
MDSELVSETEDDDKKKERKKETKVCMIDAATLLSLC